MRHEQMENGVFERQNASICFVLFVLCDSNALLTDMVKTRTTRSQAEKATNDKKWIKFVDYKPKSGQKQPTSLWRINCATQFVPQKISFPFTIQMYFAYAASGCVVY